MFHSPNSAHWFGHDDLGRSIGERVIRGAATSITVAFSVVLITAIFGTVFGVSIAWFGRYFDLIGVSIIDIFLAFPGILLAIALAAVLGPGIDNVIIALVAVSWVGFARLARAQTLSVKKRDHVQIAIALGTTTPSIIKRHVLPLIAAPLIVEATFAIAAVIVAEAGLSFLGLGVQPPMPSWGSMIKQGTQYLLIAPHMVIAPGVALFSMVFAINTLGDRLRDRLNVKENHI
ncbi:MAG: ABC transporter permease [Gammaproteobacteria bacterium]